MVEIPTSQLTQSNQKGSVRMPSPRALAAIAAVAAALAAVAAFTDLLSYGEAAIFLAVAYLVMLARRVDGKAHRIELRVKRHETTLQKLEQQLAALDKKLDDSAAQRNEDLAAILASLGEDRVNAMAQAEELRNLLKAAR
jgi:Skp family chaperone for outer membrane proteins